MKTGEEGLEVIKHYEGLRLKKYICAGGKPTIGYGHVILPGENLENITKEKAIELLVKDTKKAENCVNKYVHYPLLQHQFDALVSFIFNIGITAFKSSTMLNLLNKNSYRLAADQFCRWNKSKGKVLNGLIARRLTECDLFKGYGVTFYEVE